MSEAVLEQPHALPPWRILLVEDDEQMRQDVQEYLSDLVVAGRNLVVSPYDFPDALLEIEQRRADLIILDVFRGSALTGADMVGLEVLSAIQTTGFCSVILYTAHPEKVEDEASPFVRLVGKDANSLEKLKAVIEQLFSTRVPQIFRAIDEHVKAVIRDYMWNFVNKNWEVLQPISGKPEFLRVVLRRLGASFSSAGIAEASATIFDGVQDTNAAAGTVHPAEFYIMPPVDHTSIRMGDIRVRSVNGIDQHLVVLWPSCDMVFSENRQPKTDRVLCARAEGITREPEVQKYKEEPSKTKRDKVRELLKNNRAGGAERYHFVPSLCDLPDMLIDFQEIEILTIEECRGLRCPATISSPFAESISSRFLRYIGRIGTPDLDLELILDRL